MATKGIQMTLFYMAWTTLIHFGVPLGDNFIFFLSILLILFRSRVKVVRVYEKDNKFN